MSTSLAVFVVAAILCAAASAWVLRAYRRAAGASGVRAGPAFALAGAVIVAALGIYMVIGKPALAGAPFAARLEALKGRDPRTFTAEEALAVLTQAAHENPHDARPLLYSGDVYLQTGHVDEAARAYDAALRRDPNLTEAMLGLGRAMVAQEQGRVSAEALALFERVGAAGDDPAPWIYQAMAAMQDNRTADTRRLWGEALRRMRPDDPRRAMAQQMSSGAANASP